MTPHLTTFSITIPSWGMIAIAGMMIIAAVLEIWKTALRHKMDKTVRANFEAGTIDTRAWRLIEELRKSEGAAITLICDNPDFGMGPNSKVIVCDEWTGWEDKEFAGDNVRLALQSAISRRDYLKQFPPL